MKFSKIWIGASLIALAGISTANATPISSSGDVALTGSTLIDFNSEALGSFGSRVFGGVTISGIGGNLTVSNDGNGQYVPPQDNFLDNRFGGVGFNFAFSSTLSAFGMQIGATNAGQVLTAYDSLNNVLETLAIPNQVNTLPFPYTGFYGIAQAGIARVTLSANQGDWIVVDDLRYTSAPTTVTEPSLLALLSFGLIGFGFARRLRA